MSSYWFRIDWMIPAEAEEESELSFLLSHLGNLRE
jgi:hypothetical protein